LSRKLVLHPLAILFIGATLFIGEISSGTSLYFAAMATSAVSFACITYNILGGLGSISGIAFTRLALSTIVISQFGKVLTFERADTNLDVPRLTITVYAVYYCFLMLGSFAFSRIRLPLPKPAEPRTLTQSRHLYMVALAGGLVGVIGLTILGFAGGNANVSLTHGFLRALSYLLPFSLVLAVDDRIRTTNGAHSFGWMVFWPFLVMMLQGFLGASRAGFLEPLAIVAVTCYLRGFRFRRKHVALALILGASFFFFVSPFYLYARGFRGESSIREQATAMLTALESAPGRWATITRSVGEEALANPGAVNYFSTPGAATLNRFALIGPDSTLINACSTGFHYGWTALRLDFIGSLPRFIYRNRPDIGSGNYLGQLDGQEGDEIETTTYSTITTISDSFGSFGWISVMLFSFFAVPAAFVVYESIFDVRQPWGTVGTVLLFFSLTEGSMGGIIFDVIVRQPIYILVLSWCANWLIGIMPVSGDRAIAVKQSTYGSIVAGR